MVSGPFQQLSYILSVQYMNIYFSCCTIGIYLWWLFSSLSGSGEDVANDGDIPSSDNAVDPGLISPGGKPPKSPSKTGSGKKKSYATNATKATRVLQTARRTLYTAGRPPWYNSQGQLKDAFVIGEFSCLDQE